MFLYSQYRTSNTQALLDEAHLLDTLNHGNAKLGGVNSLLNSGEGGDVDGASRAERPEWPAGIERTNLRLLFFWAHYIR
jgi:hypothetical protein